jgi:hypothetical protein
MRKSAWVGFVSVIVLASICGGIHAFTERSDVTQAAALSQVETIVGVDVNPAGNTATSLGTINSCIPVDLQDSFYIDLIIQDVTNLNSVDGSFRFDGDILEVTGVDVQYILADTPGSSVSSYSDSVPNSSGSFQVTAFDYGVAPESGEGILARLEITAIGPGISKANFDWRPDDYEISGVILLDETGTAIGDTSEPPDDYFDGTILEAEIAVGEPCPGECLPDIDSDSDGFDDNVECYLSTDPLDDCPNNPSHDAWPLDSNMDMYVTVGGDVLPYRGQIGASGGPPPDPGWLQRLDLNMDNFITVGGDVLGFRGHIGDTCS